MNSKQYSDLLFDQAKDLIWMVDHKLHLIYANKSYLNLTKEIEGVEKELNTSILQGGLGEGYIEKWKAYYQRALSGDSFTIEEHFFHPFNNEKQYGQISFLPIKDKDGNVQSVACRNTDVTSIVQENYQARSLMEASLDVFCTIDEGGNFVYVSEGAKSHWGYTAEELLNTPYVRLVLEEDIAKTNQTTEAIIAGQKVKPFVNRYKRKDGSIAYNLWSARWDRVYKLMYCVARDVKETIKQKESLEQNENRFKALVQEGSDLIGILDLDGNYTYVSPTSTSIFGIVPENFIGKNAFDFIHPDDREKTLQFLQKIMEEKTVKVEPFRFQNSKGEWRWVETVLTNMLDNIDVKGIVANSRDVTDKIDTRKQLEANELFNRTLLESSPDCLKVIDAEGRIQYMNLNGFCLMEIDDFTKFKNKEWWTLWGKDNELLVKSSVEKALLGETVEFTAFCPTAKGNPKWWNVLVSPIKKTGEDVKELLSVSRDITKKKQEEQQLKLLSSVITNTNDAVLITEAEPFDETGHRIIYVNEAFTKMTGYTAEEVIGKTPRILQGPNSDFEALSKLGKALRNWDEYEITTINYKKNGDEFWVHFNVTPVADETGWYTHWIAIERDITEQKNKELELALLAEISKNFSEEDGLEDACKNVSESIQAFGKFDLVEIWCVNLERSHLQLFSQTHTHNTATINDNSTQKFVKGKGLLGKVWQLKDRQIWDKKTMNDLFLRTELSKQLQLNSVAGIPLLFQEEVIGVLVLGSNHDSRFLEKYSNIIQRLESFVASEINRKKLEGDLKHLYNAIPDIVGIADIQCRFLNINKAGSELLGYTKEELLKNSLKDIIFPEDLFRLSDVLQSFQNGIINQIFEARFLPKTGHFIVLSVQCVFNPQEELIYISAKDITEENKLRNLNTQTNKIAKIGSWEVDFEQNKAFWSDMVHQLHETDSKNFSPDLAMSINFYREDFRPMITNLISKSLEDGSEFDFEAVIVTNNKRERWVRAIGKVERFNGITKRISGSLQDISEIKETEFRLQSLSNNLPGVVFQFYLYPDGRDKLKRVSSGAKNIWGFTAEEAMQNNEQIWKQIEKGGSLEEHKKSIAQSIETKSLWKNKWKYVMPNNEIKTHLGYGTPSFLVDGTVVFNSVILDVTEETKRDELLDQTSQMARIGSWEVDLINQNGDTMYWSSMTKAIMECDINYNPSLTSGFEFYTEESKQRILEAINKLIKEGINFDEELLLITARGNERWVRCIGQSERVDNICTKIFGSLQDIHDKKVVEEQLVQALNDKNRILERITEAFVALDSDWRYTYMNKKAGEIFNLNPKEMTGKHIWTEFPEGLNKPFHLAYERAMATQQYIYFEEYYEPNDLWFENHIYPSSNGLSIFFRDITERKRSEKQLAKAYEEKNNILESIGDAFFTVSNDWIVTYWNKQAEKFLGLAKEFILGKNLWEVYSDAIDSDFYRQYHYALKTGEKVRFEEKYETLGKWFEVNAYPSATGLSIYFADVTLRKEADERLIQANERFEKVTEATNDAIWDWDIVNDQFYRSDNIYKFFGSNTSRELKREQFWQDKFHPDDIQKLKESIEKSIIDPKINRWEAEYRVIDDNENIVHVIDRGLIIRKNKGKAIRMIGAMTDVSESKRQEEKLLEINQKLETQTKELQRSNEELEQFAFITSHDLQEPLRMITSFMDQLKRKYADQLDDKALQYIHYATDGAKRMKQIILDLLLYSRANSPTEQKEPIKLNEILSEFLLLRRKLIEEKNAIISYDDLPVLVTYKAAVTQIFHCLLDNALKYCKENMPPIIDVRVREKGDFYEFAIKDNGIGIDERFYEKIFIIFQRLHNRKDYEGTGIGLSVTKRSVEFLGGEIRLESKVGEGTTFYFTILKTKN
ncbi:PAS domain S-box protein [Flavobacterium granuli]|uniref:histidine kinase n=1 Tax=Flavobacterium granuli TaxID=280093 RepID=A0A1M5S7S0_9FLAO|nr:PAS domain S-box protein [Flavobacterium granuli]PRZ21239.1 PAS domain S-box-containing protein [Flavobacterium granuli]SHH34534.1 PAS domain S-box-containing protein [Flavobacterium granuli]